MAVDFSSILSGKVDEAKRPPIKPPGTYHATITNYRLDLSQQKKTPYVEFQFANVMPGEDVDQSQLVDGEGHPIDLSKWKPRTQGLSNFYMTPDAQYRLREFLEELGIDCAGRSWNETLPEAKNKSVLLTVSMKSTEDGSGFFNNIDKVTADKS